MKKLLLVFICFSSISSYSQKIRFEYDLSGNQVSRTWCPSCDSKKNNQIIKNLNEIEDTDLQKFYPEDIISYYPNPVKEELYLRWDLINDNTVFTIEIITLNGQVLKIIKDNLNLNSQIISFIDYPIGVYFVNLNYKNGDRKVIKIIKN